MTVTSRRAVRSVVGHELAELYGGVAHRDLLRARGVTKDDVRTEIAAGRWHRAGRHTVVIDGETPTDAGRWWWAVWESGSGAVLDGASSLLVHGLTGFDLDVIDVSLPRNVRAHPPLGVRAHQPRDLDRARGEGIPRATVAAATIHAARWAVSDRQAALLVCMPVQQRLISGGRLLEAWSLAGRGRRTAFLELVIRDVCDGAQALSELDFAQWCRRYDLPEPDRQVIRKGRDGRVYLDAAWTDRGVVVEIDGGHHLLGLNPVADALRANELVLGHEKVLRLPVLGLRLEPDAFMLQVRRAVLGS